MTIIINEQFITGLFWGLLGYFAVSVIVDVFKAVSGGSPYNIRQEPTAAEKEARREEDARRNRNRVASAKLVAWTPLFLVAAIGLVAVPVLTARVMGFDFDSPPSIVKSRTAFQECLDQHRSWDCFPEINKERN